MTRVLALGTFDVPHPGHVEFLRRAGALAGEGGELTVGVNTDRFAESYKRRPLMTWEERAAVVAAFRWVTRVVPNDQADGSIRDLLDAWAPDVVAAPAAWGDGWYAQVGVPRELLAGMGVRVEWVPHTPGISTTDLIARLRR